MCFGGPGFNYICMCMHQLEAMASWKKVFPSWNTLEKICSWLVWVSMRNWASSPYWMARKREGLRNKERQIPSSSSLIYPPLGFVRPSGCSVESRRTRLEVRWPWSPQEEADRKSIRSRMLLFRKGNFLSHPIVNTPPSRVSQCPSLSAPPL